MTKPERDKRQDMLEAIYGMFAGIDPDSQEEAEEIIRSVGIDPDDYAAKIRNLAKDALEEQARYQIEAARQEYDSKKSSTTSDRQSIIQKIQEMISLLDAHQRTAFAHHRNLESASDADLQSLLDDLSYLTYSSRRE